MTLEEAEKIAKIISTADGGCSNCVIEMTEEWNKVFPEYKMTCTKEVWEHHYLDWDDDAIKLYPVVKVEAA